MLGAISPASTQAIGGVLLGLGIAVIFLGVVGVFFSWDIVSCCGKTARRGYCLIAVVGLSLAILGVIVLAFS